MTDTGPARDSGGDPHAEARDRKRRPRMQVHSKASVYLMQQAIARVATAGEMATSLAHEVNPARRRGLERERFLGRREHVGV